MMFDALKTLGSNLVIPVIYRATLKLMKGYGSKSSSRGTFVGEIHASASETKRLSRKTGRQQSAIDLEVQRIFDEIEAEEGKPLRRLDSTTVVNYVNMLSDIATRRAAEAFVGSRISTLEAKEIIGKLRESYP
jgi:hypothetical protein